MDVPPNGRYVTLVGEAIGNADYQTARSPARIHSRARSGGFFSRLRKERETEFGKEGECVSAGEKETLRTVPCRYRALVSSDIEGGASRGVLPQLRFGLLSISRISVPPLAISEWENHGLLSDLPLSRAD